MFGSTLSLEQFELTELHAAILDLNIGSRTSQQVMDSTPCQAVNELDALGRSSLSWASERGDRGKITKLLKMGADPNIPDKEGRTAFHHAGFWLRTPDELCVRELLEAGSNPNVRNTLGGTPLHDLVLNGCCPASIVENMLQHGADPNVQDKEGWTPLHWAVRNDNREAIEVLLRYGQIQEYTAREEPPL